MIRRGAWRALSMLWLAMLWLAALAAGPARAQEGVVPGLGAPGFVVEQVRVPWAAAAPAGLEAMLVKPAGSGRHPLLLISHGTPREPNERYNVTALQYYPQALEFARRGWTAVAVIRRGFGTSGGPFAESVGKRGCVNPDYLGAAQTSTQDLRAAIAVLARRDDVDATRIAAVGVSTGGMATDALTDDPPPGLLAGISFAGGRGSTAPDEVCAPDALVGAFGRLGERSRLPMLWVYAENDHFFGPALADRLVQAFTAEGGNVRFVRPGPFGSDGHMLFSAGGKAIWTPIVDQFLQAQGLVWLPAPLPLPPLPDVPAPPGLTAAGRERFATYLAAAPHKAFAMGIGGGFGIQTARHTAEQAQEEALANCRKFGAGCHVVNVDDAAP